MAEASPTDPVFGGVWEEVLGHLAAMYTDAHCAHIPVALATSPMRFQIGNAKPQRPQKILRRHASEWGVSFLDLAGVVETMIAWGHPIDSILFDETRYTSKGHRLVARALCDHVTADLAPHAFSAGRPHQSGDP